MRYATLCSGIGGFDKGFDDTGMECVYQCEIDPTCQSVLNRHWPDVPKGVDVNDGKTADDLVRLRPRLVAFGSPCQDLSVAGKRGGISAERSGLFFRCVELCYLCEADYVVWENVPGVFSSNGGADFAAVLAAFTGYCPQVPANGWRNSGVCIGSLYSVAWAVLDAQWFGVAQRRRRVFVVGSLRDRGRPYEILSLGESLPWDSAPSRDTGSRIAASLTRGTESSGKGGYAGRRREGDVNLALCLNGKNGKRYDGESESFVCETLNSGGTLRAEGHDASEDGTGRGTPIVPAIAGTLKSCGGKSGSPNGAEECDRLIAYQCHGTNVGEMGTLRRGNGSVQSGVPFTFDPRQVTNKENRTTVNPDGPTGTLHEMAQAVAYRTSGNCGVMEQGDKTAALNTATDPNQNIVCGGFKRGQGAKARSDGYQQEQAPTLTASDSGTQSPPGVQFGSMVRRLTLPECERLQGFPDDWTKHDADGKEISDSPRYRMLGNAVAVPVAEWLGKRIGVTR
jgi:DNA (cytosine-5)-methyltransferase 1